MTKKKNEVKPSERENEEENSEERQNFENALKAIFSLSPEEAKKIRESKPEPEEPKNS